MSTNDYANADEDTLQDPKTEHFSSLLLPSVDSAIMQVMCEGVLCCGSVVVVVQIERYHCMWMALLFV